MVGNSRIGGLSFFSGNQWVDDPLKLLQAGRVPAKPAPRMVERLRSWKRFGRFPSRIVHASNYFLPDWSEGGVATVHDLSVFRFPETHPIERVRAFEKGFASTLKRANLLLTDCEWTRRELIAFAGISPDTVRAVPLGVEDAFKPRSGEEVGLELNRLGLSYGGYGLCVSTLEPRKRISHLLNAWRELPHALRAKHPLVLAGGAGWQNATLMAQIERATEEGWLRYLGYVPESQLPILYAGAALFAYPSLYEGFGLPPLEAMACGIPTLVSAHTCLEEVTLGAAVLTDPEDIPEMSKALERMLIDQEWRSELSAAGRAAAASYRWSACVDRTIDAYNSVLERAI
jgi:alpha-1,3-rhamnosyl/mannosyltransferase